MPTHQNFDQHDPTGRPVRPKSGAAVNKRGTMRGNNSRTNTQGSISTGSGATGRKQGPVPGQRGVGLPRQGSKVSEARREREREKERERERTQEIVNQEPEVVENGNGYENEAEEDQNVAREIEVQAEPEPEVEPPKPETPPPPQPEVFTLVKFNNTMDNYSDVFSQNKFTNVTDDYPVDDLIGLVNDVKESVDEYKQQTLESQRHLEDLRSRMHDVKDRIQRSVQEKTNAIRMDDEAQSIDEKEVRVKLARLNAQVAQANAELAEALRLAAETESTAAEAQLTAERAKEEAQNIQEEIAFRAKVDERRRETEKKRQIEEKRQMEQQRLQEAEVVRQKEEEWKRKEHGHEKPQTWEKWPDFEFKVDGPHSDLAFIIKGNPNTFNNNCIRVHELDQLQCPVPFNEHEELVSSILEVSGRSADDENKDTIVICIPYKAPKQIPHSHSSREPVIKVENSGHWTCVETREETFDKYKDVKFAAAEVNIFSKVAVFSRLRRDYSTISKRGGKVTSTFDQRISLTIPKNCIDGRDHIIMEVQPVDSGSVNDLKTRNKDCKGLLTSSPIVHMAWESTNFDKPVTVTVPCPPNPIKAKKIAAMRKAKEEKMKNPVKIQLGPLPHEIEAAEKEKQKSKLQKMQEQLAAEENYKEEPKPTKWYMGEYAISEEDENDNLYLLSAHGNKWTPVDVNIAQVKLDLLQFDLEKPLEKFMVLRTKTSVQEDTITNMANEVSTFLSQKFVQVILKQKSEDPFDTVMSVIPSSKTEKTLKKLSLEGYDDGPEPSGVLSINEGDVIEVGFRGNIRSKSHEDLQFVYNSNLESETEFHACEVDKYLQRNFPVYRGVVEIYRKYKVKTQTKRKRRDSADEQDEPPYELRRDLMCEMAINIPKYHVEQNTAVIRAPVTIRNTSDPVNEDLVRFVAEELGDEWKTVASHLNIGRARVQAIIRSMQYGDQTDSDARFDMLMTWLKKTPKAVDKVSCLTGALLKSGRGDLSEEIKSRDREFREIHRAH